MIRCATMYIISGFKDAVSMLGQEVTLLTLKRKPIKVKPKVTLIRLFY